MNRTIWIVAAALSAPSLLLLDSAIKGAALLLLAAAVALVLRRDSAATRHLVWLLAIVALLAVPALSAMLPQWRVLPHWAGMPATTAAAVAVPPTLENPAVSAAYPGQDAKLGEFESSATAADEPAAAPPPATRLPEVRPATRQPAAALTAGNWNWLSALPLVWAIGFGVLSLRLLAARWLIWRTERQATVVAPPKLPAATSQDAIATALEAACVRLAMRRPVTLLIHPDKTIPVVWGILRSRLMLPAAARHWRGEQLQSVLLHELAHIQRRDTLAQLLTQIACALHWFNPLVWIAAWRLGVERERACDDLVLASGVRPSAYAGHLLEVVTELSPARWTQSCGLAMARSSSLECRLVAVLNSSQSRRRVSVVLAVIALASAVGIAVPLAMLRAQEETRTAETRAAEERTGAPMPQEPSKESPQKPSAGAKLKSVTEQKLKWGEPAGGLRMALAWPPTLGEAALGKAEDFFLVVQNVSQVAVRLTANDAAPNPRMLNMREDGRVLQAIGDERAMPGDWLLQPREVALFRMFQPTETAKGKLTVSAAIEQDIHLEPRFSMTAEMTIEKAPEGAWTGRLVTGQTRGSVDVIPPKNKDAQALYTSWTTAARADGKIPGGVIGLLGQSVTTFTKSNPTWETTPQLQKMLPRFDATRDWIAQDAVALLDELAVAQDTPIRMALDHEEERIIRTGTPLPPELANAPWGKALPSGLRHAWLLEPRAAEHRLGTPLKARVLIHNAGKEPVVFRTRSWHQAGHKATDAQGAEIKVDSTFWTTIGRLTPFRLAPNEFVEVNAAGIGVGPKGNSEDWQHTRVGSWVEAKVGDEVTVTTEPVPLSDWKDKPDALGGEPRWWLDHISARLARHQPFPADAEARIRLLHRVAIEVLGTSVSKEMNDAFVADTTPTALDSAAQRLFHRPGLHAWAGPLTSGPTKFRVLPADPDAAKRPRTANNPGQYTLNENVMLVVTRRPDGERIVNEAEIRFAQPEPEAARPPGPFKLKLPDGYDTWATGWVRGTTVMWVTEKGLLRKIDFSKIAKVEEMRFEADKVADAPIPPEIREALRTALDVPAAPKQQPLKSAAPAAPAAERPKGADVKIEPASLLGFWNGALRGEKVAISFHRPPADSLIHTDLYLGRATIGAPMSYKIAPDGKSVTLLLAGGPAAATEFGRLTPEEGGTLLLEVADKQLRPGKVVLTRDADEPTDEPRQQEPRALFTHWKKSALPDGKIPGALIGKLAEQVEIYVKANPNLDSGMKLPKLLPRFDASHDWPLADIVSLLDDVAYYSTEPIEALIPKDADAKQPDDAL